MKGSAINNIGYDQNKEKIVHCTACGEKAVVGKFSLNTYKCQKCRSIPKGKDSAAAKKAIGATQAKVEGRTPVNPVPEALQTNLQESFGAKLTKIADKLQFEIDGRRVYRKKYAVDGGGIATVHVMVEPEAAGQPAHLEYFSFVIQRAIGPDEDFRKIMPPDAAADCEVLVAELGLPVARRPQMGQEQCAACGAMTDEFGVDTKRGRILCIKPNQCFKRAYTSAGAQAGPSDH